MSIVPNKVDEKKYQMRLCEPKDFERSEYNKEQFEGFAINKKLMYCMDKKEELKLEGSLSGWKFQAVSILIEKCTGFDRCEKDERKLNEGVDSYVFSYFGIFDRIDFLKR